MVLHVRLRAATNCRRLPRSQTPTARDHHVVGLRSRSARGAGGGDRRRGVSFAWRRLLQVRLLAVSKKANRARVPTSKGADATRLSGGPRGARGTRSGGRQSRRLGPMPHRLHGHVSGPQPLGDEPPPFTLGHEVAGWSRRAHARNDEKMPTADQRPRRGPQRCRPASERDRWAETTNAAPKEWKVSIRVTRCSPEGREQE
jgi:hypothetical protein